ncbi:MAG: ferritin-like domain-containing protein [Bryobacteraceae bacterium]|nr:ferritin-like domain-containing protein [Bryobacteraceae bacterium]
MQNESSQNVGTRRIFALGAGLAGLALAGARTASAQSTANPDIAVLNYALALEHLEANYYTVGLARFAASDFNRANFPQVLGSGTVAGVYTNLTRIRDHEVAHVKALQDAVTSLGGVPVLACTYSFPYTDPESFLQVALVLEETGVMAYDGAIATLTAAALKSAGASIATVEARHAAYLNVVTSNIPFPRAFDQTKMMSEILAMIAPFLGNCPTAPATPATGTKAMLLPKNASVVTTPYALDASQSVAADGKALTYMTRATGKPAAVTNANTAAPIVQFNGVGTYTFELTVTDSTGATATDTTVIQYVGR